MTAERAVVPAAAPRLSCSDYSWPLLSHDAALRIIADLGFDGVDLGLFGDSTHCKLSELRSDPTGYASRIRARVDRAGLAIADVFLTPDAADLSLLDPANPDPDDRAESLRIFDATVDFATAIGAAGITLLPGRRHPGQTNSEAIEVAAASLRTRVDRAGTAGLRLSFEPHITSICDTVENTLQLVEQTPGLGVTLDPGHLVFVGIPVVEVAELAQCTSHVQLRAGGVGKMQPRLRENEIDFAFLLERLRECGYGPWLAIEYVWMAKWGCDQVDNIGETAQLKSLVDEIVTHQWAHSSFEAG